MLTTTDMAVIVSPGQNEIERMKKLGLDIEPHRRRMNESQPGLDEKFKDTDDPLRLVFVCAMWLTGFDAPSCSTIYLDKPMRNHTLMQTIARANRVFPGKHSGVIVDYANVFASLEKALAIYGAGKGGANPVKDKAELVAALRTAVDEATAFCARHGVDLVAIEALPAGGLKRLEAVENAIEALIAPEERRREFFGHEKLVGTLYRAIKPDPAALEFAERVAGILALAAAVRAKLRPDPPDITEIMGQITGLLDESIAGLTIREAGPPAIDLSKINFEALAERFKMSKHKNTEIEALKAAIRARLDRLVRLNRTRTDFAEKFEELIESYNAGSRNIQQLFEELLRLSNTPRRGAGAPRAREPQRGGAGHLRHPDATRSGTQHGGAERGQEGCEGPAWPSQGVAGVELAEEVRGPLTASPRDRGCLGCGPARGLCAGALPREVLRALRACLRELPGARCRGLR